MNAKQAKREENAEKIINDAISKAKVVDNEVDLKTAIAKKEIAIISTDDNLYKRLLKKLPKEKVSEGAKNGGLILMAIGFVLTSTFIFLGPGLAMMGAGAALGATGLAIDGAKNYSLIMDYDNKRVVFIKVKGTPKLNLPKGYSVGKIKK